MTAHTGSYRMVQILGRGSSQLRVAAHVKQLVLRVKVAIDARQCRQCRDLRQQFRTVRRRFSVALKWLI